MGKYSSNVQASYKLAWVSSVALAALVGWNSVGPLDGVHGTRPGMALARRQHSSEQSAQQTLTRSAGSHRHDAWKSVVASAARAAEPRQQLMSVSARPFQKYDQEVSAWTGDNMDAKCTQPRFVFEDLPSDEYLAALRAQEQRARPTDEQLRDTAIVTFAAGEESARMVTALLQSLRDVNTRVPNIEVMLVRGGHGSKWCDNYERKDRRGWGMNWPCSAPTAVAEDIVSPQYLQAWERLGVKYRVLDPTPDRKYSGFTGNRGAWWGMALSKLLVWTLTDYRKILWLDGDAMVFHNLDHMLLLPEFTSSGMQECDLEGSGFKTGGGFWIVDPSLETYQKLLNFMDHPVPYSRGDAFRFGDMQVVGHFFADQEPQAMQRGFPFIRDAGGGAMPGLHIFPEFRGWGAKQFLEKYGHALPPQMKPYAKNGLFIEGMLPEFVANATKAGRTIWKPVDARFDAIVGNCAVLDKARRHLGPDYYAVHFTCMPTRPHVTKPGQFDTDMALLNAMKQRMHPCLRYYFLRWYDAYVRAMGEPFPAPLYNGTTVRVIDPEADAAFSRLMQAQQ